jgi:DegV family protein with EDD domain
MSKEAPVAVVTDSGSSIRPEDKAAKEFGVTILPLDVTFYEEGQPVSYSDLTLDPQEFYQRMSESERLPTTSGAVIGRALEAYRRLTEQTNSIISVHLTSRHSNVYSSAVAASHMAMEENPELLIEVIDSKNLSLGAWYVAEAAIKAALEGFPIEDVKQEALAVVPNIETYIALASMDNLIAGGRVSTLKGLFASTLGIKPVLKVKDGVLIEHSKKRTFGKAQKALVETVALSDANIVKLAVMHANAPEPAEDVRQALQELYSGDIAVHEAGPVLGVHAGPGTVGISFQKV